MSFAFEQKVDLSAISHFDEIEQARLFNILQAYMARELLQDEIKNYYITWSSFRDRRGGRIETS